jgi:TolB-like protein
MERRLVAILAADVVGFSALMGQDERGTLDRLIHFRKTVFDPTVAQHNGRVVKLMGDGALVQFASVVDAVACAVAMQSKVMDEPDSDLRLRIGVNLGDVIVKGADIYGDGVNTAARLEAMAEPGGICISGIVHQSVGRRIEARFADAGEHALKNIAEPVQVFRWVSDNGLKQVLAPVEKVGSDKPGIAVLAFDNMSTDPEQEYFSDGIAEDIITALSHFREFFVIARNTTFTYKGQPVRVDQVCRDLGVRYLLEGSVRKSANRVRVTAQLIDGDTGAHIWAGRYDRDLDDIFAVQDDITQAIVAAVAPETMSAEIKRSQAKMPDNLNAWDKVLQARWHMARMTRSEHATARRLIGQAIAEAPDMSEAHALLALCDLQDMLHLWQSDPTAAISAASAHAKRAAELDPRNAEAFAMLGMSEAFTLNFEDAEEFLETAVRLNPNLASAHGNRAALYGLTRDYEQAKVSATRALALSPRDPLRSFWLGGVGIGAFIMQEYDDCVAISRQVLKDFPGYASSMRQETAALAMLGRDAETRASLDRLLDRMPGLTVAQVGKMVPVRHPEDRKRWLDALRRAGLPEE